MTDPDRRAAPTAHAAGWLRPVQLCLATAVQGSAGPVWPNPASFVWRPVADDQRRRRQALMALLEPASCITTDGPVLGVYRITTAEHAQTGLLADVSVAAYEAGRVKGHEHTRHEQEEALLAELDEVEALVGPVALAYRPDPELAARLRALSDAPPHVRWTSADDARHELWIVDGAELADLAPRCAELDPLYVVDGHHRIAAAARRAAERRAEGAPDVDGRDPWGAFLAAVFPADELRIRATHRVVDLAGASPDEVARGLEALGTLTPVPRPERARPRARREFGVGLGGRWYRLADLDVPPQATAPYPDVQLLDDLVLAPLFGVRDPRTDPRLDFVPDLGDLAPLEERCRGGGAAVFLVNPVTVEEVLGVAEAGTALPPKSTWFDPKPIKGAVMPATRLPRAAGGARS